MLKECEECKYVYSSKAEVCPNCGCPNIHKQNERIMQSNKDWEEEKFYRSIFGIITFGIVWWACMHFNITSGYWQIAFVIALAVGGLVSGFGTSMLSAVVGCAVIGLATAWVCNTFNIPNFIQILIFYIYMGAGFYVLFIRPFISLYKRKKYQKMAKNVHDPMHYVNEMEKERKKEERRAAKEQAKKDKSIENGVYNAEYTEKDL